MKPHPRIRKTIKWGGAAVTVLLVVVAVGTRWCWMGWDSPAGNAIDIDGGRLLLVLTHHVAGSDLVLCNWFGSGHPGWHAGRRNPPTNDWRFVFFVTDSGFVRLVVPLWIPLAISLPATVLAWRLDTLARRRARLNLCPKCNYDRAGLGAGAKCPECGTGGTPA